MGVLPAWMYVYHVCAWCCWRPKRTSEFSGTRMPEGCELSCVFWEQNFGPLQELSALFRTKSFLQVSKCVLKWKIKAWRPLLVSIPLEHVLFLFSPVLPSSFLDLNLYMFIIFIKLVCFKNLYIWFLFFFLSFSFFYYSIFSVLWGVEPRAFEHIRQP